MWKTVIKRKKIPKHEQQQHHLSGIGRFKEPYPYGPHQSGRRGIKYTMEEVFSVPWEQNQVVTEESHMIVGRLQKRRDIRVPVYAANLWDDRNQNFYPHGFPVHAYCWRVIDQIIGSVAEEELDLFVQTLRERWQKRPFEVNRCVVNRYWAGKDPEYGVLIPQCLIATADPEDIPEMKDIVDRAIKETARKQERSKLGSRGHFDLPLDIQLLVIDYLRPRDARNALAGLGWQVPLSYWRGRCSSAIKYIHEIEDAKSKEIDLEFLYQEVEELFSKNNKKKASYGLKNRKRIFRILEGTKKLFFSRLAEKNSLKN